VGSWMRVERSNTFHGVWCVVVVGEGRAVDAYSLGWTKKKSAFGLTRVSVA
jgi:hypothetical protein